MNSKTRGTVLHAVMAFVVTILMVQLWLFTESLEAVHARNGTIMIAAVVCSGMGCAAVWMLIRYFLKVEQKAQAYLN